MRLRWYDIDTWEKGNFLCVLVAFEGRWFISRHAGSQRSVFLCCEAIVLSAVNVRIGLILAI